MATRGVPTAPEKEERGAVRSDEATSKATYEEEFGMSIEQQRTGPPLMSYTSRFGARRIQNQTPLLCLLAQDGWREACHRCTQHYTPTER